MVMLTTASILAIGCGILCFYDTELAWRLYLMDRRLTGLKPVQPHDWRLRVKQVGSALIGLGAVGIMAAMNL